jgi:TrmH family RNA methyltransferase
MEAGAPIRSRENAALKRVRAVACGREPGVLLLEGERLIGDALRGGLALELVLVSEERAERARELAQAGAPVKLVQRALLDGLSRLRQPPGELALAAAPASIELARWSFAPDALVVVAAGIADPGNLGALARSAEAAGAAALVVLAGGVSPWNEKALRGSMGSLLRLPIALVPTAAVAREQLARAGFRQVRAGTRGGADHARFDWNGRLALWMAGETGADEPALRDLPAVTIPMAGAVESLNVATAAAVLLFSAQRSRGVR